MCESVCGGVGGWYKTNLSTWVVIELRAELGNKKNEKLSYLNFTIFSVVLTGVNGLIQNLNLSFYSILVNILQIYSQS